MVDNQHRLIKGYAELSEVQIVMINEVKAEGEALRKLLDRVAMVDDVDARCVAMAQTSLQAGMMWLTRAIARPGGF